MKLRFDAYKEIIFTPWLKPSDEQLDIYSLMKDYKEYFVCFLKDGSLLYELEDGFIKISVK